MRSFSQKIKRFFLFAIRSSGNIFGASSSVEILARDVLFVSFLIFLSISQLQKTPLLGNSIPTIVAKDFFFFSSFAMFFVLQKLKGRKMKMKYAFLFLLLLLSAENFIQLYFPDLKKTLLFLPWKTIIYFSLISTIALGFLVFRQERTAEISPKKEESQMNRLNPLILLIALTALAFALRIWNLDHLSPVRDEYSHLNAAKHMLQSGYFNYERAGIITHMTFWSWKIFNGGIPSVFWARFVSVFLGTLSIPLIFYLVKINSNKKIALIASFLLAISPFHIGMSRYLREYILFFDFLIAGLIFLTLAHRNIRLKKPKTSAIFLLSFAVLAVYYFFDQNSTFILNLVIWGVFSFFLMMHLLLENRIALKNKFFKMKKDKKIFFSLLLVLAVSLLSYYLFQRLILGNIHFKLHSPQYSWVENFLDQESGRQWFYDGIYAMFFTIPFLLLGTIKNRKNVLLLSSLFVFVFMLLFYTFFFNRYDDSRYAFGLQLFSVIMFSFSAYYLLEIFNKNKLTALITALFLFSFFNPIYTIESIATEKDGRKDKKQDLIHRDTYALMSLLKDKGFSTAEPLLTHNDGVFAFFYDYNFIEEKDTEKWDCISYKRNRDSLMSYDYIKSCPLDTIQNFETALQKFDKGWIIIDKDSNRNWKELLKTEDFATGDFFVDHLEETDAARGYDIYKWHKTTTND